jgi:tetratricopeptide (TPR) repeat protein
MDPIALPRTAPRAARAATIAAAAALLLSVPLVRAEETAVGVAQGSDRAAPTVDDLQRQWQQQPGSLARGLRFYEALVDAGRGAEALPTFRRWAQENPADPIAAFLTARAQPGKRGIEGMRAALQKSGASLDSADAAEAWRALSRAEEAAGLSAAAIASAREEVSVRPTAPAHARLGRLLERAKDPAAAAAAYRDALRIDERHLPTRNALAVLLARRKETGEAAALAARTVEWYPRSADAHLSMGLVHALTGSKDSAVASFTAALDLAGSDVPTLVALCAAFADLEQFPLAGRAVERLLALAPDQARVRVAAGAVALEEGRTKDARVHLEKASKLSGQKDARTAYLLGTAYARLEDWPSAVRELRRAVSLGDGVREHVVALALALERSGATEGAIAAYREALELSPKDADLQLRLGRLCQKKRKWRQAQDAFEAAAAIRPEDPRPHFFLAVLHGDDLHKPSEALRSLETYVRLGGKEPSALRWLEELKKRAKGKERK